MNATKKRNWRLHIKNVTSNDIVRSDTIRDMTFAHAHREAQDRMRGWKLEGAAFAIELKPEQEEIRLQQVYMGDIAQMERTLANLRGKYQDDYENLRVGSLHDPDGGCQAEGTTQYFLYGKPKDKPERPASVIFEELSENMRQTQSLLSDAHPGLSSWNGMMKERFQAIANNLAELGIAAE